MQPETPCKGQSDADFEVALRRFGLERNPAPLDASRFRAPAERGGQLDPFD